jgi:S1-C subfamily serine protease
MPEPQPEPKPEPKPVPRRSRVPRQYLTGLSQVAFGVLLALGLFVLWTTVNPGAPRLTKGDVDSAIQQALASVTPPPSVASQVFQAVRPSVVEIHTQVVGTSGKSEGGRGSGVILDDNGDILTSLHVVADAIDVQVFFFDGSDSAADIVSKDPSQDIAVLRAKILPDNMVPATLGNARSLQPGDEAIVIGSPFGITGSVTDGIVSGLNRSFKPPKAQDPLTGLIQFDTAVNPGNSGGPLLNRDGEVVGIVTGLVNPTDQDVFIGIGFAVPIETAASAAGSPPY